MVRSRKRLKPGGNHASGGPIHPRIDRARRARRAQLLQKRLWRRRSTPNDETGQREAHAWRIDLGGHKFFVCDEFPASEGGTCKSPETLGGTGVRITLLVDETDGLVERAVAAGARVSMPVQDMFWGGRYGKIVDPFGHEWGINQQVKEQGHEETQIAAAEFFAKRQ